MDGDQQIAQAPDVSAMGPPPNPGQQQPAPPPTTANSPVVTQDAQTGQMIQSPDLSQLDLDHRRGTSAVLHALGTILGGSKTIDVKSDASTGQVSLHPRDATTSEQWSRAATAALAGLARGAGAGTGPGATYRALSAGLGGGLSDAQRQQQSQLQNARQGISDQQKAQLHNANMALLNQQVADGAFQAKKRNIDFIQGQSDRANGVAANLSSNPNNRDLGVIPTAADLPKLLESEPDAIQHHVNGQIHTEPEIGDDGSVKGVHAYYMEKEWGDQRTTQPVTIRKLVPGDATKGEPATVGSYTVPAGTMTNGQVSLAQQASDKQLMDESVRRHNQTLADQEAQNKTADSQSQTALRRTEGVKNIAEANEAGQRGTLAGAQAQQLNSAPGGPLDTQAKMLVDGDMDPSQMSRRSKTYDGLIAAANKYSTDTTGKPFDMAKAAGDYKYATNKGTKDTLNYLNSLTGRDGNGGNLQNLRTLSHALPRGNYPALNDAKQWAQLQTGNPQVAAYHAALTETADQIAKILQGGSGSATSDAKLRQAGDLLGKGFSDKQIQSVATTLMPLLHNRKMEMVGDNRYLMREYGPQAAANNRTTTAAPAPQPGGTPPPPGQGAPAPGGFNWNAHPVAQ